VGGVLFVCSLPLNPPANNLFVNAGKRGRFPASRYTAWRKAAGLVLAVYARGVTLPLAGPVSLELAFSNKCRADLDNMAKAPIDLLVSTGVLIDDSRKYVKQITLSWRDIAGVSVLVRSWHDAEA